MTTPPGVEGLLELGVWDQLSLSYCWGLIIRRPCLGPWGSHPPSFPLSGLGR